MLPNRHNPAKPDTSQFAENTAIPIGSESITGDHLLAPAPGSGGRLRLICREDKPERLFAELAIHKMDLVIADRPLPSELEVKGYSHALGRTPTAFYAEPGLAARYQEGLSAIPEREPPC